MKRVVVTGMSGLSPIGQDWPSVYENLTAYRNAVCFMEEWDDCRDLHTRLATRLAPVQFPEHYDRKRTRSMGRVALLATYASELALKDAGLLDHPALTDGSTGVAYGSSSGSTDAVMHFAELKQSRSLAGITATTYLQFMSHTCVANIGMFFKIKGRLIPTCSACTSGSQAIGYAYESIKSGKQTIMVAGGAEELCISTAAVFDVLFATSTKNQDPAHTPRPFDKDRDGLVIGEGAGTLILEEYSHAVARGARIYAEVVGFGTNSDGQHITTPTPATMKQAMILSLEDAGLKPEAIGYINAHATATDTGDIAESQATAAVFGNRVPISSLKSYIGHTLGASAALEAWMTIEMMHKGWFAPNLNLENVDPRCAELDYIMHEGREVNCEYVMSNNFAFAGINTSLIFRRLS